VGTAIHRFQEIAILLLQLELDLRAQQLGRSGQFA